MTNLADFSPRFIGGDSLLNELLDIANGKSTNFPSYNLVKESDSRYRLELALAGYTEDDVSVTVEKNRLFVSSEGVKMSVDAPDEQYIQRGVARRKFRNTWILHDHLKVDAAEFVNGMLLIHMRMEVPEEEKPRQIPIGNSKQQFLTEQES